MSSKDLPQAGPFSVSEGKPKPLGVSRQGSSFNFAIYAKRAEKLSLLIFPDPNDQNFMEIRLNPDINRKKNIWCVLVAGLPEFFAYGYRIEKKKKFSAVSYPELLNDPYALSYCGGEKWGIRKHPVSRRSFYMDQPFDWQNDRLPRVPLADMIIYELHVRGFTRHASSGVSAPGTYAGLVEKIPYLRSLGITTVELLPIFEFNETLVPRINPLTGEKLLNFWGYDPLGYFAPKASYARTDKTGGAVNEFKQLVKALHRAGIELILDVVYNHTGEGPAEGPVFSFRGLDEKTYYMFDPDGRYQNFSGCGNTLNCNHPVVQKMILESLRYWVSHMHVDGFRFDLASILSRGPGGSVCVNPPLLEKIKMDPLLSGVKLIAEAWDAGGLYQVGSFPGGAQWAEWNDKFRDTIRRYVRGDQHTVPELATRLAGSSDLYQYSNRSPLNSINYITGHDGFTLTDLVSFNCKRNKANGENNRDGMNENFSANYGKEGPSSRSEINRLRKKQIKNMATLLMLAQGVPMILAGDEFGRTQQGNNNAYCQDNEISWLDWNLLKKNAGQFRFFKFLILFRKNHRALRRGKFFLPDDAGNHQIVWYDPGLHTPNWADHSFCLAFHLIPYKGDRDIFFMSNSAKQKQIFLLPAPSPRKSWYLSLNTAGESPDDIYEPGEELLLTDQNKFKLDEQSTVVLIAK